MKRAQSGFGAIEALLILILLTVVGFTGYYVYHSQKNSNSSYNNAAQSSSSTPATASSSNKFVFKELGIQMTLNDRLKGLRYRTDSGNLYITDSTYDAAINKCSDSQQSNEIGGGYTAIGKTDGQYPADANPIQDGILLKQFTNFYVTYGVPNGNGCSDLSQSQNLHDVADQERGYFVDQFKATATEVK